MNEKFKLLALEAKMGTADFDVGRYDVATPDRMQKLCELIVRECADVGSKFSQAHPEDICYQIKRHFGVEL